MRDKALRSCPPCRICRADRSCCRSHASLSCPFPLGQRLPPSALGQAPRLPVLFVSRGLQILHMRFQLRPRVLEDVLGVLGVPAAEALLAARLAEVAVHAVGGGERVLDCDQLSRPSSCRAQDWLAARVRRSPRVLAVDLDVVQQVSYVAPRCSLS
eukprot:TRINITY_DN68190_c4_g1_i4.p1 TRINITY_DN68190_c4_g1~~TRINITY_DN68190_c4_g1_i4.p1  ORF type:complete len:156 (+),score=7.17 TRINITY_DN68190_c4_g1_i4:242-709(+)